jgi:hypothetical protein
MASFDLQWRKSTSKDLRRIPREAVSRIIAGVEKLAEEPLPRGSEKLSGSERTGFALAIIASCTSFSAMRKLWKFNACGIGKTFTGTTNCKLSTLKRFTCHAVALATAARGEPEFVA